MNIVSRSSVADGDEEETKDENEEETEEKTKEEGEEETGKPSPGL